MTDELDLEQMFAAARARRDTLPDALAARMLADAAQVQTDGRTNGAKTPVATRPGVWAQLRAGLGGWTGMSGLATACAAGVWIGLAPPDFLPDPVGLVYQQELEVDLIFGVDETGILTEDG
ncbi:hypothetical protein TRL7639_02712 [Falsiruegeria litorea R37]|uniref:Dihydroorotate dehydrogenase n=1 Tax=Falsiruegeria litorea R37 TaxID=1200284 RepID=A0A1Y5SVR2_9RHOB|nr:hypothetical protein [Falsiruegeria litorea]SLN49130.1 hypothetical protein TRL7639_02712 [Falsiruegeria litorea R37]